MEVFSSPLAHISDSIAPAMMLFVPSDFATALGSTGAVRASVSIFSLYSIKKLQLLALYKDYGITALTSVLPSSLRLLRRQQLLLAIFSLCCGLLCFLLRSLAMLVWLIL